MDISFVVGASANGIHKLLAKHRTLLLTGCAVGCLLAAPPALADGGWGGTGNSGGPGVDNPTGAGGNGGYPSASWGGGGGGGAGTTGGNGGDGLGYGSGPGGAGGSTAGADGGDGTSANTNHGGGGGGGGGAHGSVGTSPDVTVAGAVSGGKGGKGGDGDGSGGGGGGGGYGVVLSGTANIAVLNTAGVTGGKGGAGGGGSGGKGGSGGSGGIGVYFVDGGTLTNEGGIAGGNGGAHGSGAYGDGGDGNGGAGVVGGDLAIINIGSIAGGLGGDGVTLANAITFSGGTNSLTMEAGSTITGNVVAFSTNDTFALGGATDQSFDVSQIGAAAQYRGFGHFAKTGSSTWTLTGTTSDVTPWTISAGTLKVSSDGNLGDSSGGLTFDGGTLQWGASFDLSSTRAIALNAGGGTFDTNGFDTTISQEITGGGSLTKTGAGKLTLTGANTYTGGTTISTGMLEIGDESHAGASVAGNVTVGAAGTLMGHGTVGGNVFNSLGGIVAPGGSIGTLSIGGNYTQGSGSVLSIEVSPLAASALDVTGTASLGGTLNLIYAPGVYGANSFTIVSAANVTGTFSTVTSNASAALFQSVDYTSTSAVLSPSGGYEVAPTDDTVFSALGVALLDGAQEANGTLLDRLGGARNGTGGTTSAALAQPVRVAVAGEEGLKGLLVPAPQYSTWAQANGRLSSLDGNGTAPGFDTRSGDFMAGVDKAFGEDFVAGIAGGYALTYVSESSGSSGHIDTPRVALYAGFTAGALALDATLGYAHDFIDGRRLITPVGKTATSSHEGNEVTGALQASLGLDALGATIVPRAGLRYAHLSEEGFGETGAPGFNLDVASRDADSLRPFVGASASKSFTTDGGTTLTPKIDVEYSRETMNSAPADTVTVGGGSFIVDGLQPTRDRVTVGAGIEASVSRNLTLHAGYDATLPTGNLFAQTVEVGVSYAF